MAKARVRPLGKQAQQMSNTVRWLDTDFTVYPLLGTNWNAVPGVYIFAGQRYGPQGRVWYAIYVGQTESLAARLTNHDRSQEALRAGATAIHACVAPLPEQRVDLERRLIQVFQPELNVRYLSAQ